MKIIHGFHDICGIPSAIAAAEQAAGHASECIVWNAARWGAGGFVSDLKLAGEPLDRKRAAREGLRDQIIREKPDVLHIHFNDSTSSVTVMEREQSNRIADIPVRLREALMPDLTEFTTAGIRIWATFHGCDVREKDSDPVCSECTYEACAIEDKTRRIRMLRLCDVAEKVFITTPDLQTHVTAPAILQPQAVPDPLTPAREAIRARRMQDVVDNHHPYIRIAHCPSSPEKKGTRFIRDAINAIGRDNRAFEFVELGPGVSRDEILDTLAGCDLLIDQVLIGWHGTIAAEANAMGVPAIAYMAPVAFRRTCEQVGELAFSMYGTGAIFSCRSPLAPEEVGAAGPLGDILRARLDDYDQGPAAWKRRATRARAHWMRFYSPAAVVERIHRELP